MKSILYLTLGITEFSSAFADICSLQMWSQVNMNGFHFHLNFTVVNSCMWIQTLVRFWGSIQSQKSVWFSPGV